MRRTWMAAALMMAVSSTAFAVDAPPPEAKSKPCALGELEEGTLSFTADGNLWLHAGPWVVAHVELGDPLWPDNTKVVCEGTTAHVTSQGQGTFVVTMVDLDFQDFLPTAQPSEPAPPPTEAVAAR